MDRQMKASDVFDKSEYLLAQKATFAEAFPTIEKLAVDVREQTSIWARSGGGGYYTQDNAGEFVNCSNSKCFNGGFSLGTILRDMVSKNLTEWSGTKTCQGYEGSQKGRRRSRSCSNTFEIKVTVAYRPESTGSN